MLENARAELMAIISECIVKARLARLPPPLPPTFSKGMKSLGPRDAFMSAIGFGLGLNLDLDFF